MKLSPEHTRSRPGSVTILSWLLVLEGLGMILVGAINLGARNFAWDLAIEERLFDLPFVLQGGAFLIVGWFALVVAVGFYRMWRQAWLYATSLQGMTLLVALIIYFRTRPIYVYPMMIFGIFMVLYLVNHDVRAAFESRRPEEAEG